MDMAVAVDKHMCRATSSVPGQGLQEVPGGYEVEQEPKVPIWVGLNCKLVSGIGKGTTCHDLISSILPSSEDASKYVIIEKWKKMERMLDPTVKILKVWKAWGDQIDDVSFVLRTAPTGDGYIDKKTTRKVHRKRSSNFHQQKISNHDEGEKNGHRDAMEQLIKLVITQGEAIQAQLKKLRQQEVQIERYEEKMHKIRTSQHGENYVVDTYLQDDLTKLRRPKRRDKSPSKKDHHHHLHFHSKPKEDKPEVKAASTNDPEEYDDLAGDGETIKEKTVLMENIFQLNVKLTQEEERLVKLGLKLRKLAERQRKSEWEQISMQDLTQELDQLKSVTNSQSKEIEENEENLTGLEQLLDDKHDHIAYLTREIQLIDEQSELLQRKVLEVATMEMAAEKVSGESHLEREELGKCLYHTGESGTTQGTRFKVQSCSSSCSNSSSSVCVQMGGKTPGATEAHDDSNSDTGISSLHSSVDESPMYVLDTLV